MMNGFRGSVAAAAVVLAACSYPYDPPVIEGEQGFRGIEEIARSSASTGGDAQVRVVLTHGMCSGDHRENWVRERLDNVAAAVGAATVGGLTVDAWPGEGDAVVRLYETDIVGGDVTWQLAFLTWGEAIDVARESLDYENGQVSEGVPVRAGVNAALKRELMDDCLIDAVYYLGPSGDKIRRNMRAAFCGYLGGRITGANTGAVNEATTCAGMEEHSAPLVLVPESLGSKVLFDAINDLGAGSAARAFTSTFGPLEAIHFATNQIPLLNVASDYGETGGVVAFDGGNERSGGIQPLSDLAGVLALGGATGPGFFADGGGMEVVVYTDPNDPFGYRLRPEHLGRSDVALSNVLISNVPTWGGVFADPIGAHRDTARSEVFEMIVHGWPGADG